MSSIDSAPSSVRGWFAAQQPGAEPGEVLRSMLSPEIVFDFAGRRITGVDAVLERVKAMPSSRLGLVEWSVLPGSDEHQVTVRGTGPGGTPLSSPGGPMVAMDFEFTLDDNGLIASVSPHPHHSEPGDLAAPLAPGVRAPNFTLPDVEGFDYALLVDGAPATVVIFTCNPCPWALGWHERIQRVARDYLDRGVRFLQINANDPAISPRDTIEHSRKRVLDGQFSGPYLIDEGQVVARRWGARHTPDVFVFDAKGVVAYHGAPDASVDDESLEAAWLRSALDHVLADETPEPATTEPVGCTIKWTL